MNINLQPDLSLAAAPLTQVLMNALNLASQTDADSLISYSAPARVEPMMLIDAELAMMEDLPKIASATNNLFSCYYVAGATRSMNVDSYRILQSIDHLKPTRSTASALGEFVSNSYGLSGKGTGNLRGDAAKEVGSRVIEMVGESITGSLAMPGYTMRMEALPGGSSKKQGKFLARVATDKEKKEFDRVAREQATAGLKEQVQAETKAMLTAQGQDTSVKKGAVDYMEAAHLVTGKVFELSASYGGNKVTVQVMVSLDARITRPGNLVDIWAVGGELRTAKEMFHGWRSGRLQFVRDVIMCSHLIDAELRVGIHDETGSFLKNRENDAGNRLSAILTGKRSVGTAAGIAIFHANTARKLELAIGGKLDDFNTRQKAFKRTFSLILMVIDPNREEITIYHRGLDKVNHLPISEYVKTRGKDGGDVTDIVKLFLGGSAPTL